MKHFTLKTQERQLETHEQSWKNNTKTDFGEI